MTLIKILSVVPFGKIYFEAIELKLGNNSRFIAYRVTDGKNGLTHKKREFDSKESMLWSFPYYGNDDLWVETGSGLGYGIKRKDHANALLKYIEEKRGLDILL